MGDFASVLEFLRPLLELIAVGGICGWTICWTLGLTFMTLGMAVAVGVAGVVVGWNLWVTMGWSFGPFLSGFPILPSVAGTLLTALAVDLCCRLYDDTLRPRQALRPSAESRRARSSVISDSIPPPVVRPLNHHLPPREARFEPPVSR